MCNTERVNLDAALPPIQREEVSDVLNRFKSLFSTLLGRAEGVQHCINIGTLNLLPLPRTE